MIKVVNISQGLLTVDSLQTKLKHGESLEFGSWAEAIATAPELAVYRSRVPPRIAVVTETKPAETKPPTPQQPMVPSEANGSVPVDDPEIAKLAATLGQSTTPN